MRKIKLQPAPFIDNIRDGHSMVEMTKLPYPFYVDEDGKVDQQDFWKGDPARVIGFQRDLAVQHIDLWWKDAAQDPQKTVGMYLVTSDAQGEWGTHQTAISDVSVIGGE